MWARKHDNQVSKELSNQDTRAWALEMPGRFYSLWDVDMHVRGDGRGNIFRSNDSTHIQARHLRVATLCSYCCQLEPTSRHCWPNLIDRKTDKFLLLHVCVVMHSESVHSQNKTRLMYVKWIISLGMQSWTVWEFENENSAATVKWLKSEEKKYCDQTSPSTKHAQIRHARPWRNISFCKPAVTVFMWMSPRVYFPNTFFI